MTTENQRGALKFVGSIIWQLSEWSNIGLGRFAPTVFGWMIGSKGEPK